MPARDVVTGAAGFIGSHLVDRLLKDGRTVVGIDDFDSYYPRPFKRANLRTALRHPRFRFLERDLLTFDVGPLLDEGGRLFHLAAQPGVRGSWGTKFSRYLRNNVHVTQKLLETARSRSLGRFVYASSSSIYGEQPEGPADETARPNPVSPYGVTKLSGEHLCRVYRKAYGTPAVALRFFTVYGPRQRPDMAFHRFCQSLRGGLPITLFGDGTQTRDFTFVGDIVEGIVAAGEAPTEESTFNLGGGSPAPLAKAIELLGEVAGREPTFDRSARPVGDPNATWADTRLAQKELGFQPRVSLREGLARQWEWHVGPDGPRPPKRAPARGARRR